MGPAAVISFWVIITSYPNLSPAWSTRRRLTGMEASVAAPSADEENKSRQEPIRQERERQERAAEGTAAPRDRDHLLLELHIRRPNPG